MPEHYHRQVRPNTRNTREQRDRYMDHISHVEDTRPAPYYGTVVNHPNDEGGATVQGVSARFYASLLRERESTDPILQNTDYHSAAWVDKMESLSDSEIGDIYRTEFYERPQIPEISNAAGEDIGLDIMGEAVRSGQGAAIRRAQNTLYDMWEANPESNMFPPQTRLQDGTMVPRTRANTVDGGVGPDMLGALSTVQRARQTGAFRTRFYDSLQGDQAGNPDFGAGWASRWNYLRNLQMAGGRIPGRAPRVQVAARQPGINSPPDDDQEGDPVANPNTRSVNIEDIPGLVGYQTLTAGQPAQTTPVRSVNIEDIPGLTNPPAPVQPQRGPEGDRFSAMAEGLGNLTDTLSDSPTALRIGGTVAGLGAAAATFPIWGPAASVGATALAVKASLPAALMFLGGAGGDYAAQQKEMELPEGDPAHRSEWNPWRTATEGAINTIGSFYNLTGKAVKSAWIAGGDKAVQQLIKSSKGKIVMSTAGVGAGQAAAIEISEGNDLLTPEGLTHMGLGAAFGAAIGGGSAALQARQAAKELPNLAKAGAQKAQEAKEFAQQKVRDKIELLRARQVKRQERLADPKADPTKTPFRAMPREQPGKAGDIVDSPTTFSVKVKGTGQFVEQEKTFATAGARAKHMEKRVKLAKDQRGMAQALRDMNETTLHFDKKRQLEYDIEQHIRHRIKRDPAGDSAKEVRRFQSNLEAWSDMEKKALIREAKTDPALQAQLGEALKPENMALRIQDMQSKVEEKVLHEPRNRGITIDTDLNSRAHEMARDHNLWETPVANLSPDQHAQAMADLGERVTPTALPSDVQRTPFRMPVAPKTTDATGGFSVKATPAERKLARGFTKGVDQDLTKGFEVTQQQPPAKQTGVEMRPEGGVPVLHHVGRKIPSSEAYSLAQKDLDRQAIGELVMGANRGDAISLKDIPPQQVDAFVNMLDARGRGILARRLWPTSRGKPSKKLPFNIDHANARDAQDMLKWGVKGAIAAPHETLPPMPKLSGISEGDYTALFKRFAGGGYYRDAYNPKPYKAEYSETLEALQRMDNFYSKTIGARKDALAQQGEEVLSQDTMLPMMNKQLTRVREAIEDIEKREAAKIRTTQESAKGLSQGERDEWEGQYTWAEQNDLDAIRKAAKSITQRKGDARGRTVTPQKVYQQLSKKQRASLARGFHKQPLIGEGETVKLRPALAKSFKEILGLKKRSVESLVNKGIRVTPGVARELATMGQWDLLPPGVAGRIPSDHPAKGLTGPVARKIDFLRNRAVKEAASIEANTPVKAKAALSDRAKAYLLLANRVREFYDVLHGPGHIEGLGIHKGIAGMAGFGGAPQNIPRGLMEDIYSAMQTGYKAIFPTYKKLPSETQRAIRRASGSSYMFDMVPESQPGMFQNADSTGIVLGRGWTLNVDDAVGALTNDQRKWWMQNQAAVQRGEVEPPDPQLKYVTDVVRTQLDDVYNVGEGFGIAAGYEKNYWPQFLTKAARKQIMAEEGPVYDALQAQINPEMSPEGQASFARAAAIWLHDASVSRRFGNLEMHRKYPLPATITDPKGVVHQVTDDNPLNVLPSYFNGAGRRFGVVSVFGQRDVETGAMIPGSWDQTYKALLDDTLKHPDIAGKRSHSAVRAVEKVWDNLNGIQYGAGIGDNAVFNPNATGGYMEKLRGILGVSRGAALSLAALQNVVLGPVPAVSRTGLMRVLMGTAELVEESSRQAAGMQSRSGMFSNFMGLDMKNALQIAERFGAWTRSGSLVDGLSQLEYGIQLVGKQKGQSAVDTANDLMEMGARKWLKITQLERVNRYLSKMSAVSSLHMFDDAITRFKTQGDKRAIEDLREYYMFSDRDITRILNNGPEMFDIGKVMQITSSRTNLSVGLAMDTPRMFKSDVMRELFAFSSIHRAIATNAGYALKDAKNGRFGPLLWMASMPVLAQKQKDVRAWLQGRDRETGRPNMEIITESVVESGVGGMFTYITANAMHAAERGGAQGAIEGLAPTSNIAHVSKLAQLGAIVYHAMTGDVNKVSKTTRQFSSILDVIAVQGFGADPLYESGSNTILRRKGRSRPKRRTLRRKLQ